MRSQSFSVFIAAVAAFGSVFADDDVADDEIVVFGARLAQPVTEVGSSVSVITGDELEALGVDYVIDAIATVPGVSINQNGSFGGAASVRIRGASTEQTLVIVDGVVANDPTSPGGGFDFSRLDPTNIERIEVLKGPQSTLWGTDAIGGVINIVTKRPQAGLHGNAFARYGSYDSLRAGGELSAASERYDVRLSAVMHDTDGISKADELNGNSEDDGYQATTLNLSGGVALSDSVELDASLMWTDAETEFDSFVFGRQGNVGDGDELSKTEQLIGNVMLRADAFDGRFENYLQIGYNDIDRRGISADVQTFASSGDRLSYRYQGTVRLSDGQRLAFGAERESTESNDVDTAINGLFALYEIKPVDTMTLTAGIRHDDHDDFDAETTARFAAAYNPHEQWTLRASWGEGFKAPTLFQTTFFCCGASAPNTNLRPEKSDAWDIGVRYRTPDRRGDLELTYFDQNTDDLITFSFAVGGYENIAKVESRGFELDASYRIAEWLDAALRFANVDAKDGAGNRLIRVPRHSGDLQLTVNPDGALSGSLLTRYNGKEQDPNGEVAAWVRVDLTTRYRISDRVELYARLENLLDEHYQQIVGYGTPGRSGYLGARLSF